MLIMIMDHMIWCWWWWSYDPIMYFLTRAGHTLVFSSLRSFGCPLNYIHMLITTHTQNVVKLSLLRIKTPQDISIFLRKTWALENKYTWYIIYLTEGSCKGIRINPGNDITGAKTLQGGSNAAYLVSGTNSYQVLGTNFMFRPINITNTLSRLCLIKDLGDYKLSFSFFFVNP